MLTYGPYHTLRSGSYLLGMHYAASEKGNEYRVYTDIGASVLETGALEESKTWAFAWVNHPGVQIQMLSYYGAEGELQIKGAFVIPVWLLAAAGILYKWMQSSGYLSVMEKRLSGDDISTGRFGIWEKYMGYIFSSPTTLFLGDGLKAPYYSGVAPHNTYIELIFYIGIFGTVIFAVALISIFRSRKIIAKRTAFNYVLIVTFLGMSATLACFTVNDLMFYCMLMWMSMNINTDRKKGAISYEQ